MSRRSSDARRAPPKGLPRRRVTGHKQLRIEMRSTNVTKTNCPGGGAWTTVRVANLVPIYQYELECGHTEVRAKTRNAFPKRLPCATCKAEFNCQPSWGPRTKR